MWTRHLTSKRVHVLTKALRLPARISVEFLSRETEVETVRHRRWLESVALGLLSGIKKERLED